MPARGAHVFITGRRQDALNAALAQLGYNVTGIQSDVSRLDDLDAVLVLAVDASRFVTGSLRFVDGGELAHRH